MYFKLAVLIKNKRWLWGAGGCSWYGFLALFLGFCQMHVPVLILLDSHFAQNDSQYETNKDKKRLTLIIFSCLISLFWGIIPVFGAPPLNFEPSGLSCAVYDEKGGQLYTAYIICCFFFFELGPLCIVGYCKSQEKAESKASIRVFISMSIKIKLEFFFNYFNLFIKAIFGRIDFVRCLGSTHHNLHVAFCG